MNVLITIMGPLLILAGLTYLILSGVVGRIPSHSGKLLVFAAWCVSALFVALQVYVTLPTLRDLHVFLRRPHYIIWMLLYVSFTVWISAVAWFGKRTPERTASATVMARIISAVAVIMLVLATILTTLPR